MSQIIYHNHHIIPRHCGGTDDPENMVRLTTAEHAEAHRLLYKEYGHWQDKLAWQGLAGLIGKDELLMEIQHRPISEESKQKMSKAKMGKVCSKEHKANISIARMGNTNALGHIHTAEHRQKNREAQMGNTNGVGHNTEEKRRNHSEAMKRSWERRKSLKQLSLPS